MPIYQIRLGRSLEARFYLSQAQTLIKSIDYQPLNIQFHNAQGELYLKEKLYIEAESSFEKALALARRHSNLYEEAKACANLGRLALDKMDNQEAMAKLKLALATFSRIGAMFDVITIYHDLAGLFLGQGDYVRAEEMAVLELRQAKLLGYPDLCIKALTDLADCEAHTGRVRKPRAITYLLSVWPGKRAKLFHYPLDIVSYANSSISWKRLEPAMRRIFF